jgi:hypothetical protein
VRAFVEYDTFVDKAIKTASPEMIRVMQQKGQEYGEFEVEGIPVGISVGYAQGDHYIPSSPVLIIYGYDQGEDTEVIL